MEKYDDIIHLPHHESLKHPKMPELDRAAQFLPFAALTGHDAAVRETARLTGDRMSIVTFVHTAFPLPIIKNFYNLTRKDSLCTGYP